MITRRSLLCKTIWFITGCAAHKIYPRKDPGTVASNADDTALLQSALDRGGHVVLETGKRYVVSAHGEARAALRIKSSTFLD